MTSNSDSANEGASKYITNGWAIIPPHIARWLESRAKVTADTRARLRDTDWEAHQVLTSLHVVALRYARSDSGTKQVAGHGNQEQSDAWMSTVEAAAALGVTDRCIRKWINAKRLPATKSGARWLITETTSTYSN